MKTIKTYLGLCNSCLGKGFIPTPNPYTTSASSICPVCNGAKVITITEVTETEKP